MKKIKNKTTIIGLILVAFVLLVVILAPIISPHDPLEMNPANKLQPPSAEYPLGTDQLGRCVLSRIIWGGRASLGYSFCLVLLTVVTGTIIGLISGYAGGKVDRVIMSITNAFLAFPSAVLAFALAGILGASISNLILAIACVWWTTYARLVRGMVLETKGMDFVMVAHATGCTHAQVIFKHILKNIIDPILVLATLDIGGAVISIAGYSFIGLGAQPPAPEWGVMLNDAKSYIQTQPQLLLYPSLAVVLTVVSFNLLGESLKEQ